MLMLRGLACEPTGAIGTRGARRRRKGGDRSLVSGRARCSSLHACSYLSVASQTSQAAAEAQRAKEEVIVVFVLDYALVVRAQYSMSGVDIGCAIDATIAGTQTHLSDYQPSFLAFVLSNRQNSKMKNQELEANVAQLKLEGASAVGKQVAEKEQVSSGVE